MIKTALICVIDELLLHLVAILVIDEALSKQEFSEVIINLWKSPHYTLYQQMTQQTIKIPIQSTQKQRNQSMTLTI